MPDAPGPTYTAYSPDGRYIITAGTNNALRKFTVASEDEPETLDDCQELNTALAVLVSGRFSCRRKIADPDATER